MRGECSMQGAMDALIVYEGPGPSYKDRTRSGLSPGERVRSTAIVVPAGRLEGFECCAMREGDCLLAACVLMRQTGRWELSGLILADKECSRRARCHPYLRYYFRAHQLDG